MSHQPSLVRGILRPLLLLIFLILPTCASPDSRVSPSEQPTAFSATPVPATTNTPIASPVSTQVLDQATPAATLVFRTPEQQLGTPLPCTQATQQALRSPVRSPQFSSDAPCRRLASRIPILEYHDTEFKMKPTIQMKTEWFLEQMEWLHQNGYETLTGEELLRFVRGEAQPPQRSVVLRFDIGLPAYENYNGVADQNYNKNANPNSR